MEETLDADRCWQAVLNRDSAFDGSFFFGVLTTGVYCRPGCAARSPKRTNVRFYSSPAAAESDGLRPCLRCRPLEQTSRERIVALCRYLEQHADSPLTLADLSREAGLSPAHLQRTFKAITGVSPKEFLDKCRIDHFKNTLRASGSVTDAVFDAGYGSLSRLYERSGARLGMTPMEYRSGGRGVGITYAAVRTALGLVLIGATDRGICFLQFGDSEEQLRASLAAEYPRATLQPMADAYSAQFEEWMDALKSYIEGNPPIHSLPLHVRGTAFQMCVWKYLQSIPSGESQSYESVAQGIGRPGAARAVARACASNRVALLIPCHRVIRGTGEPGGYRWGLERKRRLLEAEAGQATSSAERSLDTSF